MEAASPATVSRLGVVYVAPTDLGWLPLVQEWIGREHMKSLMGDAVRAHLIDRFDNVISDALAFFVDRSVKDTIPVPAVQCVVTTCSVFEALMRRMPGMSFFGAGGRDVVQYGWLLLFLYGSRGGNVRVFAGLTLLNGDKQALAAADKLFGIAFAWGVGGAVSAAHRWVLQRLPVCRLVALTWMPRSQRRV